MDVRKKVLLDLFASPGTLFPLVGGLSLLIASWAFSSAAAAVLGILGVLTGLGLSATKLIWKLEDITNDAYDYVHAEEVKKQEEKLDDLDQRLRKDHDPRTQNSLRELRKLYRSFAEDVQSGKLARSASEVMEVMGELFRKCVDQLEYSYELWQTARKKPPEERDQVLQNREQVIEEVIDTVKHVERTVEQFRGFAAKRTDDNLQQLRDELDEAIRVARRTEDRMATWDEKTYTEAEFE
jgi:hypothetical protein